jgi:hypothetical protein
VREWIARAERNPNPRITGAVYLLYFLAAISGSLLAGWPRLSLTVNLISTALYIALTLLLYYLFKPVNKSLSLLAALFSLAGCAITALAFVDRAPSNISPLAFFGPFCLLIGYLIFRSTFLPRILAVLMALAGLGWLAFLTPLANYLALYLKVLGFVAELSLMFWLITKGVNVQRWKEQASAANRA